MQDQTQPRSYTGGCLCGAIRFVATGTPTDPHSCSCEFCRRHSGALTLAWVEFDRDDISWVGPGGAPSLFRSSDYSSRAFCPACGSSLGAIDDEPVVALLVGAFDNPDLPELAPLGHSFVDRRPSWWHVAG